MSPANAEKLIVHSKSIGIAKSILVEDLIVKHFFNDDTNIDKKINDELEKTHEELYYISEQIKKQSEKYRLLALKCKN